VLDIDGTLVDDRSLFGTGYAVQLGDRLEHGCGARFALLVIAN
jgi:hypothetical protein